MKKGARRVLAFVLILAVLTAGATVFVAARTKAAHKDKLTTVLEVMALVKSKYVDPVSFTSLTRAYSKQGTIPGMLKILNDPYTRYMNKADYASFQEQTEGTFAGIGVAVDIEGEYVVVVQPYAGTPGEKAGLKRGDLIIAVDGKSTRNMALDAAVSMIRGPAGTTVRLTIQRTTPAGKETKEFSIVRAMVHIPTVDYKLLDDRIGPIGYVSVRQFSRGTAKEMAAALASLKSSNVKGLILDLRYNPGGLLDEAVDLCAQFVPGGPILSVVDRSRVKQPIYARSYQPFGRPVVVLVNEWSASASEITAGALKDDKVGTLVGVTTFGKGVVQTIFPLMSGGGLSLTTSRYLTAGGHSIHKIGINPDVKVELPETAKTDLQYDKGLEVLRDLITEAGSGGK